MSNPNVSFVRSPLVTRSGGRVVGSWQQLLGAAAASSTAITYGSITAGGGFIDRDSLFDALYPTPVAPTPIRTLYVDAQNGNDTTGDGTAGNPYRTLTYITAHAQAGDRWYLRGTFNAHGYIWNGASGTLANPVQLMVWPGFSATLTSDSASYQTFGGSQSYWWIQGLTLLDGGGSSYYCYEMYGADGWVFIGNEFVNVGLHFYQCSDWRFYENTYSGSLGSYLDYGSGDFIFIQYSSNNWEIVRNTLTGSCGHSLTDCSYQNPAEPTCTGGVVVRNEYSNYWAGGLILNGKSVGFLVACNDMHGCGLYPDSQSGTREPLQIMGTDHVVRYNRIWDSAWYGIAIQAYDFNTFVQVCLRNTIEFNTIFNCGLSPIQIFVHSFGGAAVYPTDCDYNLVQNNLGWANCLDSTLLSGGLDPNGRVKMVAYIDSEWSDGEVGNNQFRNNFFDDPEVDTDWLMWKSVGGGASNYGLTASQLNAYTNCSDNIGTGDGTLDPLFFSEATPDFRLSSGSPCINAGIDVGEDYNGTAPDIGAYEMAA